MALVILPSTHPRKRLFCDLTQDAEDQQSDDDIEVFQYLPPVKKKCRFHTTLSGILYDQHDGLFMISRMLDARDIAKLFCISNSLRIKLHQNKFKPFNILSLSININLTCYDFGSSLPLDAYYKVSSARVDVPVWLSKDAKSRSNQDFLGLSRFQNISKLLISHNYESTECVDFMTLVLKSLPLTQINTLEFQYQRDWVCNLDSYCPLPQQITSLTVPFLANGGSMYLNIIVLTITHNDTVSGLLNTITILPNLKVLHVTETTLDTTVTVLRPIEVYIREKYNYTFNVGKFQRCRGSLVCLTVTDESFVNTVEYLEILDQYQQVKYTLDEIKEKCSLISRKNWPHLNKITIASYAYPNIELEASSLIWGVSNDQIIIEWIPLKRNDPYTLDFAFGSGPVGTNDQIKQRAILGLTPLW